MSKSNKNKTEQLDNSATNASWGGRFNEPVDAFVARFTASVDFDQRLAMQDIQGSIAHAKMLAKVGVLTADELEQLLRVWLRLVMKSIRVHLHGRKFLKMFI